MALSASAINAVYYPSWAVYGNRPPSTLPVDSITHVFYAFARPNENGTLDFVDAWADDQMLVDGERGSLRALAKLKGEYSHLTTVLSVGGGGGSKEFPAVAASAQTRFAFATAVRKFVDEYSLDGVDIDWEHPSDASEGANFIQLLQILRAHLPEPQYVLTAALPVAVDCLSHINLTAASQVLDYLNLMGYDFAGPWSALSGHQARLLPTTGLAVDSPQPRTSCHLGVDYLVRNGFPRQKILLGIPAYARCFVGASGPGDAFEKEGSDPVKYSDLPEAWITNATVDDESGAASFVDDQEGGKGFVSFDVPATVRQKAGYVKSMGLAGLFYWNAAGDVNGSNSLVTAGRQALDAL